MSADSPERSAETPESAPRATTLELGVLVSGSGSNFQAILDAIAEGRLDARCKVVISNRPGVQALERAKAAGVPAVVIDHKQYKSREDFDRKLTATLREHGVEWVALAGFMRVLTSEFLSPFAGRIVNIHPALLPSFPGVDGQGQAFRYGVRLAGCTVHFVDDGVDTGPIIAQAVVPVLDHDTEDSLKARILEQEHRIFPEVLNWIAKGEVELCSQDSARPGVRLLGGHTGAFWGGELPDESARNSTQ